MRDHVTDELISAYVDGELEGDELKLVEGLLARSPEHRQLLAEFQALRASMWSLPSFNLPDDFPGRVVSQIEERAATPSEELVTRRTKARPRSSVFFAAASLAAVIAVTITLPPPTLGPTRPARTSAPFEMPVYLRRTPDYAMVFNITVTQSGHEKRVVERLFQQLEIGIDPTLRLNRELEKDLVEHRLPWGYSGPDVVAPLVDPDAPKKPDEDVEMIYVAGKMMVFEKLFDGLREMQDVGDEISGLDFGMVFKTDQLELMHRLHDSARDHFAQRTNIVPPGDGQAFRLTFNLKLTSISVPGSASFPFPAFRAKEAFPNDSRTLPSVDVTGDETDRTVNGSRVKSQFAGADTSDVADQKGSSKGQNSKGQHRWAGWGVDPAHVLVIIRYVDAEAADATIDVED